MADAKTPIFESYAAAVRACGDGYEDPALATVVKDKTIRAAKGDLSKVLDQVTVSSTLLAVLMARPESPSSVPVAVLDYGGAFGLAYFLVKQVLGLRCRWAVVETSRYVEEARGMESEELAFFRSIGEAVNWLGNVDLVYSSSALPYVPDPESVVRELLRHSPRYMFWSRIYLSSGEKLITVQTSDFAINGPGRLERSTANQVVRYPRTFFSEKAFLDLHNSQYRLALHFREGQPVMRIRGQQIIPDGHYFFAQRK